MFPSLCFGESSSPPSKKNLDPRFLVLDPVQVAIWKNGRPMFYARVHMVLEFQDAERNAQSQRLLPKVYDTLYQAISAFLNRKSVNIQQPHLKLMREFLKTKLKSIFPHEEIKDILFEHYLISPSFEATERDKSRVIESVSSLP